MSWDGVSIKREDLEFGWEEDHILVCESDDLLMSIDATVGRDVFVTVIGESDWVVENDDEHAKIRFGISREKFLEYVESLNTLVSRM